MGIKGFTLFYTPPCPTLSGPALGENVNEIPSSFFNFSVSRNVSFRLKSFNLTKWRNNDVIIIEKSYFGELLLVVTHGHSWSLACTVRQNPIQEPNLVHWISFI